MHADIGREGGPARHEGGPSAAAGRLPAAAAAAAVRPSESLSSSNQRRMVDFGKCSWLEAAAASIAVDEIAECNCPFLA